MACKHEILSTITLKVVKQLTYQHLQNFVFHFHWFRDCNSCYHTNYDSFHKIFAIHLGRSLLVVDLHRMLLWSVPDKQHFATRALHQSQQVLVTLFKSKKKNQSIVIFGLIQLNEMKILWKAIGTSIS